MEARFIKADKNSYLRFCKQDIRWPHYDWDFIETLSRASGYRNESLFAQGDGQSFFLPLMGKKVFGIYPLAFSLPFGINGGVFPESSLWMPADSRSPGNRLPTSLKKNVVFQNSHNEPFLEGLGGKRLLRSFTHVIDLKGKTFEDIFMTVIPGKTRNQIRKAMKRGLETRHVKTKESLDDFFSLYVLSNERWRRKRLKYSYNFFRQFWTKDYISVNMAYKDNIPAAGIILLNQLGRCQYWFGAMNKSFGHLRPNHLLFSMAIEDAVKRGLTMFDFGPSGAAGELSGVVRFKESFGASARAFNIYYSGNLFIYSALRVFLNFRSQHET